MRIDIPGYKALDIENIVLDYNGTFAKDGSPAPEAVSIINGLADEYRIYVLTADTYGTARELLKPLNAEVNIVRDTDDKKAFVMNLEGGTACIGNGNNDTGMFDVDDLSICVIGDEGATSAALLRSDIVVRNIANALELFRNPKRLIATLRR